jgi:hypothetical protein
MAVPAIDPNRKFHCCSNLVRMQYSGWYHKLITIGSTTASITTMAVGMDSSGNNVWYCTDGKLKTTLNRIPIINDFFVHGTEKWEKHKVKV